jgi:hypothetical protein
MQGEQSVLLLVYAVTLLVAVLISARAQRTVLSTAVLFLATGITLGEGSLGVIRLQPQDDVVLVLAELALFAVLFTDGLRVGWVQLRGAWRLPGRALLFGLPLTMVLTTMVALLLTDLSVVEALLLGAVLAPTDPVFAAALVGNERVPARLRQMLNVESDQAVRRPRPDPAAHHPTDHPDTGRRWERATATDPDRAGAPRRGTHDPQLRGAPTPCRADHRERPIRRPERTPARRVGLPLPRRPHRGERHDQPAAGPAHHRRRTRPPDQRRLRHLACEPCPDPNRAVTGSLPGGDHGRWPSPMTPVADTLAAWEWRSSPTWGRGLR